MIKCGKCGSKDIKFLKSYPINGFHTMNSLISSPLGNLNAISELYKCNKCGEITEISKTI